MPWSEIIARPDVHAAGARVLDCQGSDCNRQRPNEKDSAEEPKNDGTRAGVRCSGNPAGSDDAGNRKQSDVACAEFAAKGGGLWSQAYKNTTMGIMPIHGEQRESLKAIRIALLDLHKALLDLEKEFYEKEYGEIKTSGEYLQLVIGHPLFDWLKKLSGIIVEMDELLSPRSKLGPEEAVSAVEAVRMLLILDEHGTDYQKRYWAAVQESPDVLIEHVKATRML
jgi:hypothetical protein